MPDTTRYIAIDLGAESGRVMLGTLSADGSSLPRLALQECHRFANVPVAMAGGMRWNIQQLWADVQIGVQKAAQGADGPISGISTDSWGVDYVLLGKGSPMLAPPFQYRDPRHEPHYERALREIGPAFIFANTGIQFMSINTLYQLLSEPRELLESADALLTIADDINYLLAGGAIDPVVEISLASTTQVLDVRQRAWSEALIERVGLPGHVFPQLVDSGTVLGPCEMLTGARVIAGCSHDTACAVAAIPAEDDDKWAYISSGTWSLAGVELDHPVVTERCRELGFTNELGFAGTTRLLKNISGLYILQQCRAVWKDAGHDHDYAELAQLAEQAAPLRSLIRPECSEFGKPGDMCARIADYCRRTKQPVPQSPGEIVRCIYESLALLYRQTLSDLSELTGRSIERLHIVGGGSQSRLLNQLSADACGVPVIAGPVEATSMGNVLIQASALEHIGAGRIRDIVRHAVSPTTFRPQNPSAMAAAFKRFVDLPVS